MKIGARNAIIGTVKDVKKGSVMSSVKVDIPATQVTSVMTVESCNEMNLREGDKVHVVLKAVHVVLVKE